MNLPKEITDKICYLYNEVGDICMLEYIHKLDLKDEKAKYMLNNMLELNETMLDTDIYYKSRREFLTYLGFSLNDDNGMLEYTKSKLEEDNYYYIVFVLGRDLIKGILQYEDDTAYNFCKKVENDIDKPKTKEDKIREYIMSRNIQYDLVGEDILKILDEEE